MDMCNLYTVMYECWYLSCNCAKWWCSGTSLIQTPKLWAPLLSGQPNFNGRATDKCMCITQKVIVWQLLMASKPVRSHIVGLQHHKRLICCIRTYHQKGRNSYSFLILWTVSHMDTPSGQAAGGYTVLIV